jgi:hypothetical protein
MSPRLSLVFSFVYPLLQMGATAWLIRYTERSARLGHLPDQPLLVATACFAFAIGVINLRVGSHRRMIASAAGLALLLGAAWFWGVIWIAFERI